MPSRTQLDEQLDHPFTGHMAEQETRLTSESESHVRNVTVNSLLMQ